MPSDRSRMIDKEEDKEEVLYFYNVIVVGNSRSKEPR